MFSIVTWYSVLTHQLFVIFFSFAGISLTAEQWKKLVDNVDEINESVSAIA